MTQSDPINIYVNIRNNFLNINRNYISQVVDNSTLTTRDTFQAFCDVYNHEYYGTTGREIFENENECRVFIGENHFEFIVRLMREFNYDMNLTYHNDIVSIVNAWRYEHISGILTDEFYHEIITERSLDV